MSRIGNAPVVIPDKVNVTIDNGTLTAKGPLGELQVKISDAINVEIEDGVMNFSRINETKKVKSMHGLTRSLVANAVQGVWQGFEKTLVIEGVGYKAEMRGDRLYLALGFSHPILFIAPDNISFSTPTQNTVIIKGIDKQIVGLIAARIRKLRPPEPYKGKGIRYQGEYIRRKAGKTAA